MAYSRGWTLLGLCGPTVSCPLALLALGPGLRPEPIIFGRIRFQFDLIEICVCEIELQLSNFSHTLVQEKKKHSLGVKVMP